MVYRSNATLTRTANNKKLSCCCDSRSYCCTPVLHLSPLQKHVVLPPFNSHRGSPLNAVKQLRVTRNNNNHTDERRISIDLSGGASSGPTTRPQKAKRVTLKSPLKFSILLLLLLLLLISFIWRKFEGCSKCAMSTVTGVIAYVMRNVFSRARKTDSDMSVEVQLVDCSTQSDH